MMHTFNIVILILVVSVTNSFSQDIWKIEKDSCIGIEENGLKEGIWRCNNIEGINEAEFFRGKINGQYKVYYPNTKQLKYESFIIDDVEEGRENCYSISGTLLFTRYYSKGIKLSEISYYESGQIKSFGVFTQDTVTVNFVSFDKETLLEKIQKVKQLKSVKDKKWIYYSPEGKLEKIEVYEKGNCINSILYR